MCMNYLNLSRAWSWSIYMFCISCPSTNQLLVITQEYKRVEFHSIHLFCNKVLNRIKPVHVTAQQARYRSLLNMSFFDRKYWSVWSITWRQGVTNLGGPILDNDDGDPEQPQGPQQQQPQQLVQISLTTRSSKQCLGHPCIQQPLSKRSVSCKLAGSSLCVYT